MARPKNKEQLVLESRKAYKKLLLLVENLSGEEREAAFPEGYLNRNVRDVLAHIHHWHVLMLEWYRVGKSGTKPDMPAKGYTWKTVPALNAWIREQYTGKSLDEVRVMLDQSSRMMDTLIEDEDAETLFVKKHLNWTGSTSLGSYLVSATSSHYNWAFKLIKKCLKG